MDKEKKLVVGEIEYDRDNNSNVHSDIDFEFNVVDGVRAFLHELLDEWLNNSNGTGGFYVKGSNHKFDE